MRENILMSNLHNVAALCVALSLTAGISAQEANDSPAEQDLEFVKGKAAGFFRSLTDKTLGPDRAFFELVGGGPLQDRTDEIGKLIEQAQTLDQRYGAYTGNELVAAKAVGEDLIFLRYLYKGERFPVVWYFTFYRPAPIAAGVRREWALIALRFDARIEALEK
jgi:hypothetical protein